jgi:hypothetical protein
MRTSCFWTFLIFLCIRFGAQAQPVNLADSLRNVFKEKAKFTAKLDSRNSFITGKSAQIRGVKAGISFGNRFMMGIGYNWLGTEINETIETIHGTKLAEIRFAYVAPFIEYVFYKKNNWQADIPVQIGFGRSLYQYEHFGAKQITARDNVVLYEPSMIVEYQVLGLFGFGGGIGYRLMLKGNRELEQQFTSPMYVIRFRVLFDGVRKMIKEG